MLFETVEKIVNEHIDLIQISPTALAQGKDRAAKFLVVESILTNHLKTLEEVLAKLQTLETATYAQALSVAGGKNITENKAIAETDKSYSGAREQKENCQAEINWVKTHMKIFENAHLMFRQFTRES